MNSEVTFMNSIKILVVDDEARMRKLIRDFLEREGYIVLEAEYGNAALDVFFANKDISLILLDVMMPNMDGYAVCKEIREYSQVPIIMLTALGDETNELKSFNLGVDEFISKPFSPKILVARIGAVLKRTKSEDIDSSVMEIGKLTMDKSAHIVKCGDEVITLSFKEFELLSYFMDNVGIVLSREKILNMVWNYDYFGDARTVDTHVKKLRSKLGDCGDYIKTVWGIGYKFEVE